MNRRPLPLLAIAALSGLLACAHPTPTVAVRPAYPAMSVIPIPQSVQTTGGAVFTITSATAIVADTTDVDERRAAVALVAVLRPSTGYVLPIVATLDSVRAATRAPNDTARRTNIRLRLVDSKVAREGYSLAADADSVVITAGVGPGLFHGVQTLRQLLPFGIESHQSAIRMGPWQVASIRVTDDARYPWRGAMLDVARHFFTPDEVKQYIDILALYKFNVLHLHLADDQGWRIEIKSHPELTAKGAHSEVGGGPGGYFTQADYGDLVQYAADRYVTIVPEIDMPAHINAALISHPELSCGRRPPAVYTAINVGFSAICPDSAGTYAFLDDVIGEIAAMTPAPYMHIGGDEVQALNATQYAHFVARVQEIVKKHGKRMIGWEEIAKAPIDSTSIVQMWQGDSLPTPVPRGGDLILSGAKRLYLDMKYTKSTELGLRWAGYNDVRVAYDWDPATAFKGLGSAHVLGLEAPLWSETIRNITAAEFLAMPRLPAIAEVAWSPAARRSWDDFSLRLSAQAPRWNLLGINFYHSTQVVW